MILIDGKIIAKNILDELAHTIHTQHLTPGLAILLVGDDQPSHLYVRNKKKAANRVGVDIHEYRFADTVTEHHILQTIQFLNADPDIHGIIVQLPLPPQLSASAIIMAIDPAKDADGFHPANLEKLNRPNHYPLPVPAMSVIECINYALTQSTDNQKPLSAAIVCKSDIFYSPLATLLQAQHIPSHHCTQLEPSIADYDMVVMAMGAKQALTKGYIKPGAIVIDVGIHHVSKHTVVGDTDFDGIKDKVRAITPVPGGVGPVTVAILLTNTVQLCIAQTKKQEPV